MGWNTNTNRPAPTTWEEQQQQQAQDQFSSLGQQAIADQGTAAGTRNRATADADSAISRLGTPQQSAMAGWTATQAPPSSMAKWMGAMPQWNGGAASQPARLVSREGAGGGGAGPNAWDKFSSEELRTFDPSAAGTQFAEGAFGDFKSKLGDELDALQNRSVGMGRLRSGWLNKDQGQTVTRLGSDFSNALSRAALDFSGQRLGALTSATGFEADRARGTNDYNLGMIRENNAMSTAASERASRETMAANEMASNNWQAQLRAAMEQAGLESQNWRFGEEMGFNKAKFMSESDQRANEFATSSILGRERTANDNYSSAAERASGYASSALDRADYARELADLRKEIARLRAGTSGPATTGGGVAQINPVDGVNSRVAAAFGVPYTKY